MPISLPKEILIATNNNGKFVEIADLLKTIDILTISTAGFNLAEPEETGFTYAENALIKAKYYANKTNLFSLADDSGLSIDALNGEPGVNSARWAIDHDGNRNFNLAFDRIAYQLKEKNIDIYSQKITAKFVCNLCLFNPKTEFFINFEGQVRGMITFPPRGKKGFGYDPIFIKDGYDLTFGEIEPSKKDQISHRAIAFSKMLDWLRQDNPKNGTIELTN